MFLEHGTKTVGSTVVLAIKPGVDGAPGRYKARWVAQGFSQIPGVHFTDTFAPTPQQSVFRILLSIAVQYGLSLRQMDVHTAFLIPDLPEEEVIYMRVPPDLYSLLRECGVKIKKGQVLRLNKCIYKRRSVGTKDSSALSPSWVSSKFQKNHVCL